MLKVLLIKTSSMGYLIHTMPAVTDLAIQRPDIELHWLVEEGFSGIPVWHPFVKTVHTCAIRRWRKSLLSAATWQEIRSLKARLQAEGFDRVIDAQGLLKNAWMAHWLKGEKHGFDKRSIKEPLASKVYDIKHSISRQQDATTRNRQLFGAAMDYPLPDNGPVFGLQIAKPDGFAISTDKPYAVLLHGTHWPSKIWPLPYWQALADKLQQGGVKIFVPWGHDAEKHRATAIAVNNRATVLDRQPLDALAYLLQNARFVIGSDTGLTHLAAAQGTRTIGIYGATSARLTGLVGTDAISLEADMDCSPCMRRQCPKLGSSDGFIPCYATVDPDRVLQALDGHHG